VNAHDSKSIFLPYEDCRFLRTGCNSDEEVAATYFTILSSPYQSPSKTMRNTAINFHDALRSKHANLQPVSQLRSGL
jgi:hypothetical protein